jgi:N-acetylmuramoyl-L-alanine amidase
MNPSNFVFCTFEGDTTTPPVIWVAEITMMEPVRQAFSCRLMDTGEILSVDYSQGANSQWPASNDTETKYLLNMHDIYETIPASPEQNDTALLTFPDGSKFLCFVESIGETTAVQLYHAPYPRVIIDDQSIIETDWTVHTSGEIYSSLQKCSINLDIPKEPVFGIFSGGWWSIATRREAHPVRVGGAITPFAVVIHTTDMTPESLDSLIRGWTTTPGEGKRRGVGAHFVIGRTATDGVIQLVPITLKAAHAEGPGHGSFAAGGQRWQPNDVAVGIELHCAGGLMQHNGKWRLFDEGVPTGAAIPDSDVIPDPQRPGRGWHIVTEYQYEQLNALLDGLEAALDPMPEGCVATSIEAPPTWGMFPTGRIVGHVSLKASNRQDPWPPTCDWLRAR